MSEVPLYHCTEIGNCGHFTVRDTNWPLLEGNHFAKEMTFPGPDYAGELHVILRPALFYGFP